MHGQQQDVILVVQPYKTGADERGFLYIEGQCRFCSGQPLGLNILLRIAAQVMDWKLDLQFWRNHLYWMPIDADKAGPQNFMPPYDFIECAFQRFYLQVNLQRQRHRQVVDRGPGHELVKKPKSLLGK